MTEEKMQAVGRLQLWARVRALAANQSGWNLENVN